MRSLGKHGPSCSDLGLCCMGMSGTYGPADEAESIATIHAALDAGINLLDTGDYYKGATVAQFATAWVLCRGTDIVPLIGVRTREHLNEALGASKLILTSNDFARIERLIPAGAAAGEQYAPQVMATPDSERKELPKRL